MAVQNRNSAVNLFPRVVEWLIEHQFTWENQGKVCWHEVAEVNLFHLTHCPLPWDRVLVKRGNRLVYPEDATHEECQEQEVRVEIVRLGRVEGMARTSHLVFWSGEEPAILGYLEEFIVPILHLDEGQAEVEQATWGVNRLGEEVARVRVHPWDIDFVERDDDIPF